MKVAVWILSAVLAFVGQSAYALDGKLARGLAKEFEKSCISDVPKVNPLADKKATAAYCKCYGQETAAGMSSEDLGAMLSDKETPHFGQLLDDTTTLCGRRHFKTPPRPKYDDLPDIGLDDLVRTKAGIFTAKPTPDMTVVVDSEQIYMVKIKDLSCWWGVEPSMNQSSRETIAKMKAGWPALAKMLMKSQDAQINIFEETRVRNRPAVYMEITGNRELSPGKFQDTVILVTVTMEIDKGALVSGSCMINAAQYERFKSPMKKLTTAAMSARKYRD